LKLKKTEVVAPISGEHLPLVDQIPVCVAGVEAQELFNCPKHEYAAIGDYQKVRVLLAGLTHAESYEYRHAGYLRALQILKVDCRKLRR
jgi:hypothetical protein